MLAQPYNKLIQVIALAIFWSNPLEAPTPFDIFEMISGH